MWSKNLLVLLLVCSIFSPGTEVSSRKLSNIFRSSSKKTNGKSSYKKIQPSAPPQPVGWGNHEAQVKHYVPAQTQPKPIDNPIQRPIGWNIGAPNQHTHQIGSQLPPSNAGNFGPPQIPNPSNVGSFGPAHMPQPPQNPFPNNFGGPAAIPAQNPFPNGFGGPAAIPPQNPFPNGFGGPAAIPPQNPFPNGFGGPAAIPPQNPFPNGFGGPGAILPQNPFPNSNGYPAGSHVPQNPGNQGSGIGSILGSNILGNALSGLTLWQLMKNNRQTPENHNIINNYYNNATIAVNETVTGNQSFPIKQTFDNGTILLQDDTIIYPNGTLILSNGTTFNTVVNQNETLNNDSVSLNGQNNSNIVTNGTGELNNGTIVEQKDTPMSTNGTMELNNTTLVINGTLELKKETESTLNGTKSAPYSSSDITLKCSILLYSSILILYFF